jgi:hypothetical protein
MAYRIMSKAAGTERPLSFDSNGAVTPWLVGSSTPWAGLPIEAHRIRFFESQDETGALDGECGLLVITDGKLEVAARSGGREVRGVMSAGSTFLVSGADPATRVRVSGSRSGSRGSRSRRCRRGSAAAGTSPAIRRCLVSSGS